MNTSDDDDGNQSNPILKNNVTCSPLSPIKIRLSMSKYREFQRVVAIFAYDSNSESMTIQRQQDFIYKVVHGSAEFNVVPQLELLVQGDNKRYPSLYRPQVIPDPPGKEIIGKPKIILPLYSPNNNTLKLCLLATTMKSMLVSFNELHSITSHMQLAGLLWPRHLML